MCNATLKKGETLLLFLSVEINRLKGIGAHNKTYMCTGKVKGVSFLAVIFSFFLIFLLFRYFLLYPCKSTHTNQCKIEKVVSFTYFYSKTNHISPLSIYNTIHIYYFYNNHVYLHGYCNFLFDYFNLFSLSLSLSLSFCEFQIPFSLSFLSHHLLQFGGAANQDEQIVKPKLKSWDLWWWKYGPVEVKNELWSWRHCLQSGRTFSLVLRKFKEFALWDFCGGIRALASTAPCKMPF